MSTKVAPEESSPDLALYLYKSKTSRIFSRQPNVEFEEEIGDLEYLPHPIFESEEALKEILLWTAKALSEGAIDPKRIWMGVYYDHEIEKGLYPRLIVRRIDEEIGFGVFADEQIAPQSFLGEYTGLIRRKKSRHDGESVYTFSYTSWRMGKYPYVISAEWMGNFTRLINHSDEPNVEPICVYRKGMPRIIFISRHEIPKGGQILFDYGKIFWQQVPHLRKRTL